MANNVVPLAFRDKAESVQKLTESTVTRLAVKPGERDAYLWDGGLPGFGIRAYSSGKKSFIVKYQLSDGRQRKMSLGPVQSGMLNETRKAAAAILLKARNGQDVAGEKRAARERAKHAKPDKTSGEIVRTYLALKQSAVRPSTYREIERHLLKFFAPLHDRPIETIGRRDIVEIVDGLVIRGKRVQADRFKTNCVTFFNWAIEYDFLPANPAAGISRRTPPEQLARDRVLSMNEIAAIWSETGGHSDFDKALRLLILTGARRREIGSLQWAEVDFDTAEIRLPKERVKNKMAHTIFLSAPALAILRSVEQKKNKPTLFGRTSGGFDGWPKCKKRLDDKLGDRVKPWRIHDLRRTIATNASDLGLASVVTIEMALGHWSGEKKGIVRTYNKSTHDAERRRLMADWADAVLGAVNAQEE
jgi:integrase